MKYWKIGSPDKNIVNKLILGCGVTSLAAAVLAAKGCSSPESAAEALNADSLSDPFLIRDMQSAVDAISCAIDNDDKICVYGDYDCDGVMATAILYSFLLETGADVSYYIPERSEGYGMNIAAVEKIAADGVKLIITVDNGISAISEAEHIYSLGMKLVVTDHHRPGEQLPKAEAVVDPHRIDCPSPFKHFCGAAIALKLVAALSDETFALEQFGDLAAIATVADIVSLTGENRFLAAYGIEQIQNTDRNSLLALKEVSGLTEKTIDSRSIGFGLAPRINASGRFGSPLTALDLMLTDDPDDAMELAQELNRLNNARKDAEKQIMSDICAMIDADPGLAYDRVIFLCGKGWHHGVIGIVAAKVLEIFGKPCFIASEDNGEIRGSARSFGEFSVFSALTAASGALEKFGGHPGAGGFTVKPGMAEEFRRLLNEYAAAEHPKMPFYELSADVTVAPSELTVKNASGLSILEPYGADNEKPLFFIENSEILSVLPLSGGVHTKLKLKLADKLLDGLMFGTPTDSLSVKSGDRCDMIVSLEPNNFRGTVSVDIHISDIRVHGFDQDRYFAALRAFESHMRGEKLPKNYYPSMLPTREMAVKIYKSIPAEGIDLDTLYLRLGDPQINYCRFRVAVEAMRQLGLAALSDAGFRINRTKVSGKTDLNSAPILSELREIISAS